MKRQNNTQNYLYFRYQYDLVRIDEPGTIVERHFVKDNDQHGKLLLNPETKQWAFSFDDKLVADKHAIWQPEFIEDLQMSWQIVEKYTWTGTNLFNKYRLPNYFAPKPPKIIDFCADKYAPLKAYFHGPADVKSITEDELVTLVDPTDKILMLAFYRNVLQPLMNRPEPWLTYEPTFKFDPMRASSKETGSRYEVCC